MSPDRRQLRSLNVRRLQRSVEYTLLAAFFLFVALAFRQWLDPFLGILLSGAAFGMSFQLAVMREGRRTAPPASRRRISAEAFESVIFLVIVALLGLGTTGWFGVPVQEFTAYQAAAFSAFFLAAMLAELYWQRRYFPQLDSERQENYIANLRRTIILPYTMSRRR